MRVMKVIGGSMGVDCWGRKWCRSLDPTTYLLYRYSVLLHAQLAIHL